MKGTKQSGGELGEMAYKKAHCEVCEPHAQSEGSLFNMTQVLSAPMSKVVRVYDPSRNPPEWNALLKDSQVAVFIEDGHKELPLGGAEPTCEIFENLPSAEAHCKELVRQNPELRCSIFDQNGRGREPLAVYEDPKLVNRELSIRFRRWSSAALMIAAVALISYDWRSDFERMWPSVLAWKFVTTALVFITWETVLILQRRIKRRR